MKETTRLPGRLTSTPTSGGSSSSLIIVIKLGTSSIVHETTHQPLLSTLSAVVETVVHLRRVLGHKVVLVSSGAIGVGLQRMEMASRPKSLSGKQALAAIGQGRLIALWDNLFGQLGQPIAQVLLTRGDISDRTRYLNAVNTFKELLSMGVVPIVNENDTVSVSEIKFGDNDTLSAITSSMIHADYLFLLTDVNGLYTSNPRKDPSAKQIEVVTSVASIRSQVSTTTLGSSLGTGGMETKLIAAEIATAAGVKTIITSSKIPENIARIIEFYDASANVKPVPRNAIASAASSGDLLLASREQPTTENTLPREDASPSAADRPPHTMFMASSSPIRDLKSWTSHTLFPAGSVVIDAGAHHVLSRRESGGRLLAAGVLGVIGAFASGQAVRIVIRKRNAVEAVVNPGGGGADEDAAARVAYESAMEAMTRTRPSTPTLGSSSSSSVSSSASASTVALPLPLKAGSHGAEGTGVHQQQQQQARITTWQQQHVIGSEDEGPTEKGENEGEVVEVGRGLANYNSAQISRVKGLNSSQLSQILGYADSEYVVENITIRLPPNLTGR